MGTQHSCTLFVTLLAGFEVLISRLSGQEDLVIGVPMAGQALLDNSYLVGHCVNTIPLRCRVEQTSRFVDHLKSVRHAFLDAQSHQQLTFGSLVRRLNVPRDPGRTPLVSVMFQIEKIGAPLDFGDIELESVESPPKRFVNFEILIEILDTGRDLLLKCEYNTDLFTATTIARWLDHYGVLLESIASGAEQFIDELPLLKDAVRRQLLVEWNETNTNYPANTPIHELFEAQARRTPDVVAVEYAGRQLTYGELNARANQLAHHLIALGVGPEVPVGLCVERSLEMVVGLLGILKAGGAYLPLDPDYPRERLAYMLEDAAVAVLLTQRNLDERLPRQSAKRVYLDDRENTAAYPETNPAPRVTPDNLAYVIYTSGSTGRPKGVAMPHRALVNLLSWHLHDPILSRPAKTLQFASLSFDVSFQEAFSTWCSGGTLVLISEELAARCIAPCWRCMHEQAIEQTSSCPSIPWLCSTWRKRLLD